MNDEEKYKIRIGTENLISDYLLETASNRRECSTETRLAWVLMNELQKVFPREVEFEFLNPKLLNDEVLGLIDSMKSFYSSSSMYCRSQQRKISELEEALRKK